MEGESVLHEGGRRGRSGMMMMIAAMAANFSRDKKRTDRALSQWEEKWQGQGPCDLQQHELLERDADQA